MHHQTGRRPFLSRAASEGGSGNTAGGGGRRTAHHDLMVLNIGIGGWVASGGNHDGEAAAAAEQGRRGGSGVDTSWRPPPLPNQPPPSSGSGARPWRGAAGGAGRVRPSIFNGGRTGAGRIEQPWISKLAEHGRRGEVSAGPSARRPISYALRQIPPSSVAKVPGAGLDRAAPDIYWGIGQKPYTIETLDLPNS
jgi:hypothetical protein